MVDKTSGHKVIVIKCHHQDHDLFLKLDIMYDVQLDSGKIVTWTETYIKRHFKPTGEKLPDIIGALYD